MSKCAYQESCIECPSEQYLDLDTQEWITECNTKTQITINDTQFENRPICRSFKYYVNPDSESVVEFGTKAYPYKNLSFVFVELLNYHSHHDRNISIFVKENTQNYFYVDNNFIVNITLVEMLSYSDDETVTPGKPIITATKKKNWLTVKELLSIFYRNMKWKHQKLS